MLADACLPAQRLFCRRCYGAAIFDSAAAADALFFAMPDDTPLFTITP